MRTLPPGRDAHHPGAAGSSVCSPEARAASERLTLKQLLRSYVEQGLNATSTGSASKRSSHTLPRLEGPLAIEGQHLSNAALFDLLDA